MSELLTRTTSRYVLHARLLWRAAPGLSLLALLATVLNAAALTAGLVTSGHLVGALPDLLRDGAGSAAADRAVFWLVWTAVAFIAAPLAGAASTALAQAVSARYLVTTFDMLLEAGTDPYHIDGFDDPDLSGRLTGLHTSMREWTFVSGVDSTWIVLQSRLTGVGALAVVCTWRWWVGLVLMAGLLLMNKAFTTWINTIYDVLLASAGTAQRRATYLQRLLTRGDTGKEVRLFGLSGWALDQFRITWLAAMRPIWRHRSSTVRPVLATIAVVVALTVGAFALLARDVAAGTVGLAGLTSLVLALLQMEQFGPLGDPQTELARNTAAAAELVAVRRMVGLPPLPAPAPHLRDAGEPTPNSGQPATIDFDDVTFTYPARSQPSVRNLSLHIPAGQSVAVVGVNGVGKSTLIKLLCGLYRTDSGAVRVDDRDPAADPASRQRVAVIFQDFVRYHLPLRDNVGFGASGSAIGDATLAASLADAGGDGLLDRLPHGWDTVLSPGYTDGTDLSGGQWQRIALARALTALAGGAGVLVLDEPTAALDVRAEAALFDRFLAVTRGMTTVLVSHRLSSVRHADRIVVLGPGTDGRGAILEDGTHEELLAAGGEYAVMFGLQAQRFTAAGAAGAEEGS